MLQYGYADSLKMSIAAEIGLKQGESLILLRLCCFSGV